MNEPEVLSERVLEQHGPFCRVRRYLRGCHPHLGTLHWGLTGWETVVEVDVIRPQYRLLDRQAIPRAA